MNAQKVGTWASTLVLLVALLTMLAPAPATARYALPAPPERYALPAPPAASRPVLCQVASPSVDEVNVLNAVTATPPGPIGEGPEFLHMWAVGYSAARLPVNTARATLILFYNGETWQRVLSPNPGTENVLTAVSAQSATDVWAVGYTRANGITQALILHYDGSAWSVWPTPTMSGGNSTPANVYLNDVQAIGVKGSREAVAVGYTEKLGYARPLVLYYNGATWLPMSISQEILLGRLYAVTGSSINSLWAVGTLEFGETKEAYLFHYYPETGWTLLAKGEGELTDLAVVDSNVLVTGHITTAGGQQTLAMSYSPKTGDLLRIKTYNKPVDHNVLTGLAVSYGKVYAVGYADNLAKGTRETLVMTYTGDTFLPVSTPNPAPMSQLNAATFMAGRFWAVGYGGQGLQSKTLILTDQCASKTLSTR